MKGENTVQDNDHTSWVIPRPSFYISDTLHTGLTIFMFVGAALVLMYAVKLARSRNQSYPLYVCLGSALAAFYEPLGDLFAHIAYFDAGNLQYVNAFGNAVPLFALPGYVISFGLPILIITAKLESGISQKEWMLMFFGTVFATALFELPFLHAGVHNYYGDNQPFKIIGYPVWMAFPNALAPFAAISVVHLALKTSVFVRHPVLFVAVVPGVIAGSHLAVSLPFATAINGPNSLLTVNLAAIASILLAILYSWIFGEIVCRTKPDHNSH
jgi:hypothetical protein